MFSSINPPQMQITKVYAVIGGFDHEGQDFKSLRLFDCFSTATAYQHQLEEVEGYDYADLTTREIIMESTFTTTSRLNTKDGITTPW